MATAYNNNPTLLSQRAQLRATDEQVPQALSNWRPTVVVTSEIGRSRIDSTRTQAEELTPISTALTVSQPVYRGGRTVAGVQQAEATVVSQRAQLTATEQAVLLEVATVYMNVLRDQALLDLNIKNVEVLRRQLEAAQDRFRVGEITRTDVAQAEARLSRAIALRVQSAANLQASIAAYANLVGHPPENLQPPETIADLPESLEVAQALAAESNPSVVSGVFAARAADYGVDVVFGELLPTVSLNGTLARTEDQQVRNVRTDVAEATLNLTVPLYQSGAVYSRVRQQKHVANQRRIQVVDTRRDAVEAATRAWEALQAARAQIQSFRDQIRAAEIALEGVQREAQVGARTVLDVLDAEQELLDSRVNLVVSQRDEQVAAYQVLSAVGRLTADVLDLPVEIYDPTEHYLEVRGKWFGTDVELVPVVDTN